MQCKICGKPIDRGMYCSDNCYKTAQRIAANTNRIITTTRKLPITKVTCTTCTKEYYYTYGEKAKKELRLAWY